MISLNKALTITILSAILIGSLVLLRSCDKKKKEGITDEKLTKNEQTAIIIEPYSGKITKITRVPGNGNAIQPSVLRGGKSITSPESTETIERIDGSRDTRISIDKDGKVSITTRTFGFINDFGVGVYKTPSDTRIFVDDQIFFYKRHGFNLGVGRSIADVGNQTEMQKYQLHAAYSYRLLYVKLSNTFIVVGMDTKKEILLGLRVNF